MTDKEIIIDGINVSELTDEQLVCMNRYEVARLFAKLVDILSKIEDDYNNAQDDRVRMWTDNTGLTEKLKRKEQECDELKKTVMYKCPQCGEEYLSPIGASLYEENNNLKEEKAKYYQQTLDVEIQINELLQTLAEIKEIAEENIRIADLEGLNGVYRRGLAKQILQKISECEAENE